MGVSGSNTPDNVYPSHPIEGPDLPERTQGMRKGLFALAAVGLLATGSIAACGDDKGSDSGSGSGSSSTGKVGVILPDTKSSQRWGTDDPKFLKAAFEAA